MSSPLNPKRPRSSSPDPTPPTELAPGKQQRSAASSSALQTPPELDRGASGLHEPQNEPLIAGEEGAAQGDGGCEVADAEAGGGPQVACDTVTRAQIADIAEKVFPMSGGGPVDINATGLVAVPYNQILFDVDKVAEEFISNERLRLPWRLPPQQLKARVVAWLLAGVLGGPLVEGKDAVRYGNRIFERIKTVNNKVKAIRKRERELVRQVTITAKSDGTEEFVLELTVGFLAEDAQREVAELMNDDPYPVPELCATARTAAAAAACTTLVAAPAAAPAPIAAPAAAPAAVSISAAAAWACRCARSSSGCTTMACSWQTCTRWTTTPGGRRRARRSRSWCASAMD